MSDTMNMNDANCEKVVHQCLEVQARVSVAPTVKPGRPSVLCIASEFSSPGDRCELCRACCHTRKGPERTCCSTFTVTQLLCIEIPLVFDVDVDIDGGIVHCGKPQIGPCQPSLKRPGDTDG